MKILVIVVTYNGVKWIDKCFSTLLSSTIPVSIFIVDNASTDDTVPQLKNKFPNIELVESNSNLGFGKANNIGLKKAIKENFDYVFLLNQDAWIEENTIEKLIEVSKSNTTYGILSPFHFSYDGLKTETYFNDFVLDHYTKSYNEDLKNNNLKQIYTSQFIHAACWLMPINTIKNIGGFDPLFFHYGEDNDYVQRLQYNNLLVGLVPQVKVFHFGTNEALTDNKNNTSFLINQIVLQLKNPFATLPGAIKLFFKQYFQIKNSSNTSIYLKEAYNFNFKNIFKIIWSRKTQTKKLAYLKF